MNGSAPLRWFWRIYIPVALAALVVMVALFAGPTLEEHFFPIRSNQSTSAVYRDPRHLCWTSETDKLRLAQSDNIDTFLERSNGDVSFPEIYDEATGRPWHRNGALPVGDGIINRFCIALTPDVDSREPLRLRAIIHYRGWLGLWIVRVPLPDVVSRPAPP